MRWIQIRVMVMVRVEETDSGLGHEYVLEHELGSDIGCGLIYALGYGLEYGWGYELEYEVGYGL